MSNIKLDILAFGAHPDDVELGCGGTIIKHVENGFKVGIIDLTKGDLGTRGNAKIRLEEADSASKVMGLSVRENLNFKDGFFTNDIDHQMKLIEIIRKYRPKLILCNAIDNRHIDHPKGAKLVMDSCFLSGLKKIKTNLDGVDQNPWRPTNIYHYIQWKNLKPDFVVDISDFCRVSFVGVG